MDTKAFKRALNKSDNYYRNQGFGEQAAVEGQLETEYQSDLIQQIRDQHYTFTRGPVTIKLAKSFGFCWGVERAVAMAYEARQHFPEQTLWITNEIIHNPEDACLKSSKNQIIPRGNHGKYMRKTVQFSELLVLDMNVKSQFASCIFIKKIRL